MTDNLKSLYNQLQAQEQKLDQTKKLYDKELKGVANLALTPYNLAMRLGQYLQARRNHQNVSKLKRKILTDLASLKSATQKDSTHIITMKVYKTTFNLINGRHFNTTIDYLSVICKALCQIIQNGDKDYFKHVYSKQINSIINRFIHKPQSFHVGHKQLTRKQMKQVINEMMNGLSVPDK